MSTSETRTLELRYRQAYRTGRIEVNGAITSDDIRPDSLRGYLFAKGSFSLPRGYKLAFDLETVSDDGYLLDYGTSGKDRLNSAIEISRFNRDGFRFAALTAYQSLRDREVNEPQPAIIAAFAAGLAFGHAVKVRGNFIYEFMESEGQFLTLLTFLVFGAAMLPEGLAGLSWDALLYALLSLTVLRMLPVALSLAGSGVSLATTGFLGWFGPRGLASILFALLIVERYDLARAQELLAITIVTVGLSVLLHGITAAPLARAYGRLMQGRLDADRPPGPEHRPVSEMRVRHRYGDGDRSRRG